MQGRTGEMVIGVLAILVGLGVIVALAIGIELPWILVPAMALAVIGWSIYYYAVIRPARTGALRSEDSPPHEPEQE
jgi:hypothetical protein